MSDSASKAGEAKKSDLGVRAVSAVVMIAVAGVAIWLGGLVFTAFAAAVALGVLWEWNRLASRIAQSGAARALWLLGGIVYVGVAVWNLVSLRDSGDGLISVTSLILLIIAIDVGAYASGRTFGGPKIAPGISPNKTWAGYYGAVAAVFLLVAPWWYRGADGEWSAPVGLFYVLLFALTVAAVAQAGDFFESWMKRRAGVKDSSDLIPGHGGLFDRVDGLLAVLFVGVVVHGAILVATIPMEPQTHSIKIDLPA